MSLFSQSSFSGNRLLTAVLAATLIVALCMPVVNAVFVYPQFERELVQNTQDDAVLVAEHLASAVLPSASPWTRTTFTPDTLRKIQNIETAFKLMRVKVFTRGGEIVYSTDSNEIGGINEHEYFREIVAKGKPYSVIVEKGAESLEGKSMPMDVVETYAPIMRSGLFAGAVEIYFDITERRARLERLLRISSTSMVFLSLGMSMVAFIAYGKARRNAAMKAQVDALREDVEQITRHDLKGPLGGIVSGTRLMEELGLHGKQAEVNSAIQQAAFRMIDLINRSLDLYKMEQGTYQSFPASVDLLNVVSNVLGELEASARVRNLLLVATVGGKAASGTGVWVMAEETLCHSLLCNLVKNALEASPPGSRVSLDFSPGDPVSLEIHNQGAIPDDIQGRLFEKFSTSGKRDGTGLGLYSARLMTEAQGGTIEVRSAPERGTTVTLKFPAARGGGFASDGAEPEA